ncbi:MAG: hypothetical protein ACFFCS_28200 [Candidatus Hodarchaeota archaeon]
MPVEYFGPQGYLTVQEAFSLGLFICILGYFVLIIFYFLFIRFRKTKRMYWLYFSLFFIFLTASRVAYIVQDFFLPDNGVVWKIANVTAWVGVGALSGILGILLFTGDSKFQTWFKRIFPLIPVGIGIHIIFLPDTMITGPPLYFGMGIAKFYMNVIILPIYIILLPFMFFYLAHKSLGTLQKSFMLNGLGLLIYYIARALQPVMPYLIGPGWTQSLLPPLLILLAILLISFANQYEHLK